MCLGFFVCTFLLFYVCVVVFLFIRVFEYLYSRAYARVFVCVRVLSFLFLLLFASGPNIFIFVHRLFSFPLFF